MTTAYASEVCPTQLRAYLTTYVNLCWVMGQLIGSGVLRSLVDRTDQWSYRIPFAIQVSVVPFPTSREGRGKISSVRQVEKSQPLQSRKTKLLTSATVDLASSDHHWSFICSRVTLVSPSSRMDCLLTDPIQVVGPPWQNRRRQEIPREVDFVQERRRVFQCRRDNCNDGYNE